MVEARQERMSGGGLLKRRRNKTVHFVEAGGGSAGASTGGGASSLAGSRSGSCHSLPGQFEANVQQLFTFIGNVLSSWERPKSLSPREAVRLLLRGDPSFHDEEALGSPSYKHKHWKIPPGSCSALFLKKVL
jgi:hypothetical protein